MLVVPRVASCCQLPPATQRDGLESGRWKCAKLGAAYTHIQSGKAYTSSHLLMPPLLSQQLQDSAQATVRALRLQRHSSFLTWSAQLNRGLEVRFLAASWHSCLSGGGGPKVHPAVVKGPGRAVRCLLLFSMSNQAVIWLPPPLPLPRGARHTSVV